MNAPGLAAADASPSAAQRRYLRLEAAIGAVINGALSLLFTLVMFHGRAAVDGGAVVFDTLPQSFMVSLMSLMVPALLTRRRVRRGVIAPLAGNGIGDAAMVARAPLIAVAVALAAWAAHRALWSALAPAPIGFMPLLLGKIGYGALLGAVMSAWAVRSALVLPSWRK